MDDKVPLAKVMDGMDITGRNRCGDHQSLGKALPGATGVNVRTFEMSEQKQRHDAGLKRELSNLDSGHRRMMRDKSMSAAAQKKESERYQRDRMEIRRWLFDKSEE